MPKNPTKKFLNPRSPDILKWMKGKSPVQCPNCQTHFLRDAKHLQEQCKICLKDVTYTPLK